MEGSMELWSLISEFTSAIGFIKVAEFKRLCSQGKVEEVLSCLWTLKEAHEFLVPKMMKADKSEVDADTLRSRGNTFYQMRDFDKALSYYNLSIVTAPCPAFLMGDLSQNKCGTENRGASGSREDQIPSSHLGCVEGDFKALALGYANRSAVLFELEQYERCLCDLDLAFSYGYPPKLQSKLQERKIKCHIALNNVSAAREIIEITLRGLDNLPLDETEYDKTKKKLSYLDQKCLLKMDCKTKTVTPGLDYIDISNLAALKSSRLLFTCKTSKQPRLTEPHPTFPALSSAIRVTYAPSQGRRLVAQRDIHPGETLLVEESFASVLHLDPSILATHCSTCFLRCYTPHPCPNCTLVIFCSKSCQLQGIKGHHGHECKILPTLLVLNFPLPLILASRILTKVSYGQLKQWVPYLREEVRNQNPETRGLNNEGIYDSSDYRTVYHLLMGKKHLQKNNLYGVCMNAFILTKLLEASENFFINSGVPFTPSQEDFILTAYLLLHQCCGLGVHSRHVVDLKVNVNTEMYNPVNAVLGIFPTRNLVKHSCHQVSVPTFFGNTTVLRAVTFIKAGEEVTQCYGINFTDIPKRYRESMLLDNYNIICKCKACENNWPVYRHLLKDIKPKCQKCSMPISRKGKCRKCKQANPVLIPQLMRSLLTMVNTFKGHEDDRIVDSTDEQRKVVCNLIEALEKDALVPCQYYIHIQMMLCNWYYMDGNHFFVYE